MRVIISAGGTGGHLYPAVALADQLKSLNKKTDILFVTGKTDFERQLIGGAGYAINTLKVKGFRRRISLDFLRSFYWAARGFFQARKIMRRFLPHAVVGFGGAVSGPVVMAAWTRRVPTVIHEQNVVPGLTNRLLARIAGIIAVSFPETQTFFPRRKRVHVTGSPIRLKFFRTEKADALRELGLETTRKTLLIQGGSLGAQVINEAALAAYDCLREMESLQVVHISGADNFEEVSRRLTHLREPGDKVVYELMPYSDKIGLIYTAADLVVSRAGASTLAELAAWGKPAFLIPYPFAPRSHQERNARVLAGHGGARVVLNEDLSAETIVDAVNRYLFDPDRLEKMETGMRLMAKPEASQDLARLVREVALAEKSTAAEELG